MEGKGNHSIKDSCGVIMSLVLLDELHWVAVIDTQDFIKWRASADTSLRADLLEEELEMHWPQAQWMNTVHEWDFNRLAIVSSTITNFICFNFFYIFFK